MCITWDIELKYCWTLNPCNRDGLTFSQELPNHATNWHAVCRGGICLVVAKVCLFESFWCPWVCWYTCGQKFEAPNSLFYFVSETVIFSQLRTRNDPRSSLVQTFVSLLTDGDLCPPGIQQDLCWCARMSRRVLELAPKNTWQKCSVIALAGLSDHPLTIVHLHC